MSFYNKLKWVCMGVLLVITVLAVVFAGPSTSTKSSGQVKYQQVR